MNDDFKVKTKNNNFSSKTKEQNWKQKVILFEL